MMKKTIFPIESRFPVNVMRSAVPRVAVYIRVGTDERARLARCAAQGHDYAEHYLRHARRGYQMKGGTAQ